ncbi:MAG: transthyretin domain [Lasallia pustulata]|uniref:Transthyretin domain n=1 Tax=Lasallia pustulata TaxID=136370 RepID=A0A5M8PSI9_9LECA|nr:MAG: transthyretin domain [Lasallia pustulata]
MTSASTRDPITCHVLDQTTGLPAPSLAVTLTVNIPPLSSSSAPATFTARTSTADGRINHWTPAAPGAAGLGETLRGLGEKGRAICGLRFDTEGYFGEGGTFFPEVEIRFFVDGEGEAARGHWHVPLLLGPWSYTTYRGS